MCFCTFMDYYQKSLPWMVDKLHGTRRSLFITLGTYYIRLLGGSNK